MAPLFNYDYTLEESGVQANQDTNQQEVANSLAKLSLVGLARLGGFGSMAGGHEEGTGGQPNGLDGPAGMPPEKPTIRKSLAAMLTPYISSKLASGAPAEVRREIERYSVFISCKRW